MEDYGHRGCLGKDESTYLSLRIANPWPSRLEALVKALLLRSKCS
jgi:hypothetical protein